MYPGGMQVRNICFVMAHGLIRGHIVPYIHIELYSNIFNIPKNNPDFYICNILELKSVHPFSIMLLTDRQPASQTDRDRQTDKSVDNDEDITSPCGGVS